MMKLFSDKRKIHKKAKSTISRIRYIIKKNGDRIEANHKERINNKLSELESSLDQSEDETITRIVKESEDLESRYLSSFTKSKLRQNLESLAIAIILALFIREFIIQPFKIPSGSMIPNLMVGDHLLVNKFIYGTKIPFTSIQILPGISDIRHGDVIVFIYPNGDNEPSKKGLHYIKRVIGLPGDKVDSKGRNIYINDKKIDLDFIRSYNNRNINTISYVDEYSEDINGNKHKVIYNNGRASTDKGVYLPLEKVPEGHYFVMGDNRDNSRDSRFWGFVPFENISGKALLTHWSWDFENDKIINKIRWNRIFKLIK